MPVSGAPVVDSDAQSKGDDANLPLKLPPVTCPSPNGLPSTQPESVAENREGRVPRRVLVMGGEKVTFADKEQLTFVPAHCVAALAAEAGDPVAARRETATTRAIPTSA